MVDTLSAQEVGVRLKKSDELVRFSVDKIEKVNFVSFKVDGQKYRRGQLGMVRTEDLNSYDQFMYYQWDVEKVNDLDALNESFDAFETNYLKVRRTKDWIGFGGFVLTTIAAVIYFDDNRPQETRNAAAFSGLGVGLLSGILSSKKSKQLLQLKRDRRNGIGD